METEKYVLFIVIFGFVNVAFYILMVYSRTPLANPVLVERMRARHPIYRNTNPLSRQKVNIEGYRYIINEEAACSGSVSLLSMITSTNGNFWQRGVIRKTWATTKEVDGEGVVTLFLLAKSDDRRTMESVREESRLYGDIILFDFQESYLNLTLKTLLGFRWIEDFCGNARFVLKTDDDVFLNYNALMRDLLMRPNKNLALGQIFENSTAVRDDTNKWYTSRNDYANDKYPPFLVGTGYVLSRDVVGKILNVAPSLTFLNWEDVFVGICLQKLGIPLTHDSRFYEFEHYRFITIEEKCNLRVLFKIHHVNMQKQRYLWSALTNLSRDSQHSACAG
ncbi:beta-1,3-galactosyltransferase 5-like [Ptychodera flava]|uniref:beta-1,3-galactosyltransferase 5-like n=1 Tax=Ptychodera flava TaxID=63121 RepID=UPI003969DB99